MSFQYFFVIFFSCLCARQKASSNFLIYVSVSYLHEISSVDQFLNVFSWDQGLAVLGEIDI